MRWYINYSTKVKKKMQEMATEQDEQRAVVDYLIKIKAKFTAICHSTYTPSIQARTKNIKDGLRRGLPDLFIIINNKAFFIEMKRRSGGVLSEFQKKWIESINNCEGIKAYVCNGFDEAKKVIDSYFLLEDIP